MNTEPPMGDDLNRMLVSMKQNVLERTAGQPPRRAPRHVGVIIGLVALIGLGSASGAVALGLVPKPFAERAPVVPTVTEDPAPPVTETEAPPSTAPVVPPVVKQASIPDGCTGLIPPADYDRIFEYSPVQQLRPALPGKTDPHIRQPRDSYPAFFDASKLYCIWQDQRADISGLTVEVGTATVAELAEQQADFEKDDFTCTDVHDGRSCQKVTQDDGFPVEETTTFYTRDTTWIQIRQVAFPTDNLLGGIVSQIWK
jgi:hypothetical protein